MPLYSFAEHDYVPEAFKPEVFQPIALSRAFSELETYHETLAIFIVLMPDRGHTSSQFADSDLLLSACKNIHQIGAHLSHFYKKSQLCSINKDII